jgi:hypothetical protein
MRGFAELGESVKTDEDGNIKRVFLASPGSGDIQISVGLSSDEHAVLTSLSRRFGPRRVRERLSIRFEGASITCHDNALELLESLGNSVLFQSDLRTERPWILKSRVEVRGLRRPNRRNEDTDFTPPEFRYDNEAISLYWYGRTARGMPLLQYLAYYQVIEYYFPRYSRIEAQDRIKSIIKDPTFNIDKQQDIAKILNVVSRSGSGGLGSERSQMRSTVEGCVTDKELREFIKEDDDRSKFFGGGKTRGLSDQGIPVRNQSHDIREEVAYRLYDIRCRIVHTKGDDSEYDLIVPFSPEVEDILHDLKIIRFIAKKILIQNSRKIEIEKYT